VIFVDRFSGDAWVWYNKGLTTDTASNSGSSVLWRAGDRTAYDGTYAGTCQYFPNLNGDTFADLHSITSEFYPLSRLHSPPDIKGMI